MVLYEQTFGLWGPAVNRTEQILAFLETLHYRNNFLLRESYCIEENSRIIDENSGFPTLQGRILTIWQPRSPRMAQNTKLKMNFDSYGVFFIWRIRRIKVRKRTVNTIFYHGPFWSPSWIPETEYRVFCLPVALKEPQYLAERAENVVKGKVIKVNVTPEAVKWMHSGRDLLCMPRQILEESFTALQVKEEALSKKEEDVSALQRQTEALLKDVFTCLKFCCHLC